MCGGGVGVGQFGPASAIYHYAKAGTAYLQKKQVGDKLKEQVFPKAPDINTKKPPKVVDPAADISLAQQHAREAAIGAYSYSDTVLTGGKGLGSTSGKSLWKSLGAS